MYNLITIKCIIDFIVKFIILTTLFILNRHLEIENLPVTKKNTKLLNIKLKNLVRV